MAQVHDGEGRGLAANYGLPVKWLEAGVCRRSRRELRARTRRVHADAWRERSDREDAREVLRVCERELAREQARSRAASFASSIPLPPGRIRPTFFKAIPREPHPDVRVAHPDARTTSRRSRQYLIDKDVVDRSVRSPRWRVEVTAAVRARDELRVD